MSSPSLATLILSQTKDQILAKLLQFCQTLGLDTESWQSGDPTRTTLDATSSRWAEWEDPTTGFPAMIRGMLLGLSQGSWLTMLLAQNFNVTRRTATYAQCQLQITNTTNADFGSFDADDITVENPHVSGSPTFRNNDPFTLGPHAVVTVTIQAEQAGSGSNSIAGNIDTLVTTLNGVTVTNLTAATATDDESDPDATTRGQAKLESTSPAGPRGAYSYFITTPELQSDGSNQTNVTRVRVLEESDFGDAIIFLAGASGALSSTDVEKAQATIEASSNPFVVNGEVVNTTDVIVAITYELWVYEDINLTSVTIEANIATALTNAIAKQPIGGDVITAGTTGYLYIDWIKAQIIEAVAPYAFKCSITTPSADVAIIMTYDSTNPSASSAQVVVLGTLTPTAVHLVAR